MNEEIITSDQWFDEAEFNEFMNQLDEEVSVQTRMKLAIAARRTSKRRAFLTKIRAKKRKGVKQLRKRARVQVRNEIKRRLGGANWSKLSYGVRKRLDDIVSKKRKFIDNIVKQVMPRVYKGESERLKKITQPKAKTQKVVESFITEEKTKSEIRASATDRKRRQRARESEIRQIDPSKMAFIVRDVTNNRIMIVDKNSFESEKHALLVKPENMSYEVAKQYSQDPNFKNTVTSQRILGAKVEQTPETTPVSKQKGGKKQDSGEQQQGSALPIAAPMQDMTQIDHTIAQWSPFIALNLMKGIGIPEMVKAKLITPDQAEMFNTSENIQQFSQQIASKFAEAFFRTTGRSITEYTPQFIAKEPVPTSAAYQSFGLYQSMPTTEVAFIHACAAGNNAKACEMSGVSPDEQAIKISIKYGRTNLYSGIMNSEINAMFQILYNIILEYLAGKTTANNMNDMFIEDSDKESIENLKKKLEAFFKQKEKDLQQYTNSYDNTIIAVSNTTDLQKKVDNAIAQLKDCKESSDKQIKNIFNTSKIFAKKFLFEMLTGRIKFDNSVYSASHLLAIDPDNVDVKFEKITEDLVQQIIDSQEIKLNFGFLNALCNTQIENSAFIQTVQMYEEGMKPVPMFQDPLMFCGKMAKMPKKTVKENYFKHSSLSVLFEQDVITDTKNVNPGQSQMSDGVNKEPTPAQKSVSPQAPELKTMSPEDIDKKNFEYQYYKNYLKNIHMVIKAATKPEQKLQALIGMFESRPHILEIAPVFFYEAMEERLGAKITPIIVNGKQRIIQVINTPVFDYNNTETVDNPMESYYSIAKQFLAERKSKKHNKSTGRDYDSEYKNYHSKPDKIKDRAARTTARRRAIRKGLVKKGDGKDIDHKDKNPRNNSWSNLRVRSKSSNRADHR